MFLEKFTFLYICYGLSLYYCNTKNNEFSRYRRIRFALISLCLKHKNVVDPPPHTHTRARRKTLIASHLLPIYLVFYLYCSTDTLSLFEALSLSLPLLPSFSLTPCVCVWYSGSCWLLARTAALLVSIFVYYCRAGFQE